LYCRPRNEIQSKRNKTKQKKKKRKEIEKERETNDNKRGTMKKYGRAET